VVADINSRVLFGVTLDTFDHGGRLAKTTKTGGGLFACCADPDQKKKELQDLKRLRDISAGIYKGKVELQDLQRLRGISAGI
jgi:hypothetical protein